MRRFFTEKPDIVEGGDAGHIALSLRMKPGEKVVLCCGGMDNICELKEISPERVVCSVIESKPSDCEPNIRLTLFQAVPKGEKSEIIVQKSVELGVYEIFFVLTERCISRPDEKSFEKKLRRYNRIALEAAKQCGRGIVPKVYGLLTLSQAAERLHRLDSAVWCSERGGEPFSALGLRPGSSIGLLIGSEGGFSDQEAETLGNEGFIPVTMGKRILRCETAPLAASAIIMNITGNM